MRQKEKQETPYSGPCDSLSFPHNKAVFGDFSGGSVAKTSCSQFREPGFDPGLGARFHKLQLKTPHVTAKMENPASCN